MKPKKQRRRDVYLFRKRFDAMIQIRRGLWQARPTAGLSGEAHPTDSHLYLKALQALVREAKRYGIVLRRSHTRVARRSALMAGLGLIRVSISENLKHSSA